MTEVERVFVEKPERALAAIHPEVADDYREARRARADVVARASRGNGGGDEGGDRNETEGLRQTLHRYRAVYEELVRG